MERNFRSLSAEQAKVIDRRLQEDLGIPALILMENAGRAVAQELLRIAPRTKSVAVFCGKGNNAGDGFVAARHLSTKGIYPDIYLAGRVCDVREQARTNLDILLRTGLRVIEVNAHRLGGIRNKIRKYSVIIDALLGIGLNGAVKGLYRDLIELINSSGSLVISVDIPSGLDATTGKILGCCVRADRTVTFIARKKGMSSAKGRKFCGKIIVKNLGVPL